MDSEELQLYSRMIDAEYDYYSYLKTKLLPQFLKETEGYVMDTTSDWYKYFVVADSPQEEEDQELKNHYKSLSLICHPDKCDASWSNKIFQIVSDAYHSKDLNTLKRLNDYWDQHGTFDHFPEINKAELISSWKRQAWYQWYQADSLIREVLIPEAEYVKRLNKNIEHVKHECQKIEKLMINARP